MGQILEINPPIYGKLIFNKDAKASQWGNGTVVLEQL